MLARIDRSCRYCMCDRAHGSRKNGFLLTGLRAISPLLSRHRSRLRVRISVGLPSKRHEFRRFDAVHLRCWLPIDRRCQTSYPLPADILDIGKHFTNCYTIRGGRLLMTIKFIWVHAFSRSRAIVVLLNGTTHFFLYIFIQFFFS